MSVLEPKVRTVGFDVPDNDQLEEASIESIPPPGFPATLVDSGTQRDDIQRQSDSVEPSSSQIGENKEDLIPSEVQDKQTNREEREIVDLTSSHDSGENQRKKRSVMDFAFGKVLGEGSFAEVACCPFLSCIFVLP
jgi:hypothetical protein